MLGAKYDLPIGDDMSLFLLTACASFLLVLLLSYAEIKKTDGSKSSYEFRVGQLFAISIQLVPAILRVLQWLFLIALVAMIFFLIFWQILDSSHYLYDTYSLLTSRNASRMVLGLIFGALFGVWAIRMYRMKPTEDQKLPVVQKIEGVALLLLLFIGVTSIPIEDYVRGISIKDGAFNFQLSSASQVGSVASNSRGEDAGRIQSKDEGNGKSGNSGSEPGLVIAASLPSLMSSDSGYMQNRSQVPDDSNNRDIVDEKVAELQRAAEKYSKNIQPFAYCALQLTSATKDNQHFRKELTRLKPIVRELFDLQNAILRRPQLTGQDLNELRDRSRKVLENLYSRLASGARRLVDSAHHLTLVGAVSDGPNALSGCASLRNAINTAYRPKKDTSVVSNSVLESELFEPGAERRPYLAILLAGLLQLEGQELAGIQVLQQWLELYSASAQTSTVPEKRDPAANWYKIRIITTQVWLFNTLYDRLGQQSGPVQKAFLAALEDAISAIEELQEIERDYKKIFMLPNTDLRDRNFQKDFGVRSRCPEGIDMSQQDDQIKLKLSGALISLKSAYARRAIYRGEIRENDIPKVTTYAEEIVDADQSCYSKYLIEIQPNGRHQAIARIRGENLLTYALFMQSLANSRKLISSSAKDQSLANLETSMNALRLASSITEPFGKPVDIQTRGVQLLDQLDSTPNQRLWEEIQTEIRRLERILNRYR